MAFTYFSNLPIIDYPAGLTVDKKARDILHRIFFDQKFLNQSDFLRTYEVKDGDRPEIISKKLYDRTDLHSIIMIINKFDEMSLNGLPPNSFIYDDYIKNKYSDSVYYMLPITGNLGATGAGLSGGYVYPMLVNRLTAGEKVFATEKNSLFQDYSKRAYVKEWNPVLSAASLDVLEGDFKAGTTIVNESNTAFFIIGHKKTGNEALHHFEAKKTTFKGSPLIKGSVIDPLSTISAFTDGVTITPIGVNKSGTTGDYQNSLSYIYNRHGSGLTGGIGLFVEAITNQQHEEREQEKKRRIFVPSTDRIRLSEFINTMSDIIESIPETST